LNAYTGGGSFWGPNYYHKGTGSGTASVSWTPTFASAGRWRVYTRWIQFSNYTTAAKYRVFHAGGETQVVVNQQNDGGRWIALGDFDFAPSSNHRIEIRDDQPSGTAAADAVKLVRLPDLPIAAADAVRFVKNTAESLLYVHTDHLGRLQKMTNASRTVVWDAQYAPFGEEHAIAGAAYNDERFPGQLWDDETGFHYNYFRDYDPKTGRYLQSDPIGLVAGLNTYGYVGGNPIRFIDPFGLLCTYSQSSGRMTCVNDQTGEIYYDQIGYSGAGSGRNNPDMQNVTNVGPIPQGTWDVGDPYNSPNTGQNTITLRPRFPNECLLTGRDCNSFRIHGNNARNDASNGCIVLPPNRINIPPGERIEVVR
jgi:RHS repeat-associated protein